jgi:hypothetical protein
MALRLSLPEPLRSGLKFLERYLLPMAALARQHLLV